MKWKLLMINNNLAAKSRWTKLSDSKYFIPAAICDAICSKQGKGGGALVCKNCRKSPCSRYSKITAWGSSRRQAPNTRAIWTSSKAAKILMSLRKSSLKTH